MQQVNQEEIFPIYKKVGQTPYQLVQAFRKKENIPSNIKVAYAGRLDPMAEGVMLFIVGEKLTGFNSYLNLQKEYEADILFGFKTDTYDILGIPNKRKNKKIETQIIKEKIINQNKLFSFPLPPFSSYKIKGKPLFYWAKENKLNEIEIPIKEVKINSLEIIDHYTLNEKEIKKIIVEKINKVKGDFRQKKISEKWKKILVNKDQQHLVFKIKISTDSGFYVRSFANKVGNDLSNGALLFHLRRIKIGKYSIDNCIKLK